MRAVKDQEAASSGFKNWAQQTIPDAAFMNVGSTAQIQQLLFAGLRNSKANSQDEIPAERVFKASNQAVYSLIYSGVLVVDFHRHCFCQDYECPTRLANRDCKSISSHRD